MRAFRLIAVLMIVAMVTSVTVAAMTAPFAADGRVLLDLAWGRVTVIDLYLALGVFIAWVAWRDGALKALLWAPIVAVTGSAGIGVYLLLVARRATSVSEALCGSRRTS